MSYALSNNIKRPFPSPSDLDDFVSFNSLQIILKSPNTVKSKLVTLIQLHNITKTVRLIVEYLQIEVAIILSFKIQLPKAKTVHYYLTLTENKKYVIWYELRLNELIKAKLLFKTILSLDYYINVYHNQFLKSFYSFLISLLHHLAEDIKVHHSLWN